MWHEFVIIQIVVKIFYYLAQSSDIFLVLRILEEGHQCMLL